MFVNQLLLGSRPFVEAYLQSDLFGKSIFAALILLSLWSWSVLLQKWWQLQEARRATRRVRESFSSGSEVSLYGECNPLRRLYNLFSEAQKADKRASAAERAEHLSLRLGGAIAEEGRLLEGSLFVLALTVSLAPFLGLLGTVWGILTTFSDLQAFGSSLQQSALSGLSLALTTTVLGLVVAIPALIGHSILKQRIRELEAEMEGFAGELLCSLREEER